MGVSLHWHPHPFTSILAPAHSDLVLTGGEEGVVVLWYPNSQQPGFIPRVAPAITHMAVSADGVRLVVCGNDNTLRFVEVSQKKVRVAITGLGLGALPSTAPIGRIARAGLAFDQRSQELLVAMPGNSALLQRYDAVRDRQCGVVGEVRVETARTRHHDARGFRRVDLQALSMNYDWLFTLERWATPAGPHQLTLKSYRRGGDDGWTLFAEVRMMMDYEVDREPAPRPHSLSGGAPVQERGDHDRRRGTGEGVAAGGEDESAEQQRGGQLRRHAHLDLRRLLRPQRGALRRHLLQRRRLRLRAGAPSLRLAVDRRFAPPAARAALAAALRTRSRILT